MAKTLDENFADWEGTAFGFGYGTGEPHILPALKRFLALCPDTGTYDHEALAREMGPAVAWLLLNALAHADIIEYGTSPRYGWLTTSGQALKAYVESKTDDELVGIVCRDRDTPCYPDACNCGPEGYEEGRVCLNPFWGDLPSRRFR
jgi:hypothetical protein